MEPTMKFRNMVRVQIFEEFELHRKVLKSDPVLQQFWESRSGGGQWRDVPTVEVVTSSHMRTEEGHGHNQT